MHIDEDTTQVVPSTSPQRPLPPLPHLVRHNLPPQVNSTQRATRRTPLTLAQAELQRTHRLQRLPDNLGLVLLPIDEALDVPPQRQGRFPTPPTRINSLIERIIQEQIRESDQLSPIIDELLAQRERQPVTDRHTRQVQATKINLLNAVKTAGNAKYYAAVAYKQTTNQPSGPLSRTNIQVPPPASHR